MSADVGIQVSVPTRGTKWSVSHLCHSAFRSASSPRLYIVSEDEHHASVKCEAVDCDFFAWRAK